MRNILKSLLSFLLIAAAAVSVNPFSASAKPAENPIHSFIPKAEQYYEGAEDYIAQCVREKQKSIDVFSYGISVDNIIHVFKSAIFTNPDIFYVDAANIQYIYNKSTNIIVSIEPEYYFSDSKIESCKKKFDKAVSGILDGVEDNWSDMRKALIIHDRLVDACEYKRQNELSYTAYSALVTKKSVCEGYARAYSYLLSEVGVENKILNNKYEAHCWNIVNISGNWYHVDVTADDPTPDSSGFVRHKFFLVSTTKLMSYETGQYDRFKSDVSFSSDYECDSKNYDSAFFRNIKSLIHFYGGSYYYINNNYKGKSVSALIKRTDSAVKAVKLIGDVWYDSRGYKYNGSYSKMCIKDGFIYFNSKREIYRYKLSTGKTSKVFTMPKFWGNDFYGVKSGGSFIFADRKKNQTESCAKSKVLQITSSNKVIQLPFIRYTSMTLKVKKTFVMTVYRGSGAVTYTSSDKRTAKVNSLGKIKALKKGKCTITAQKNGRTMQCEITVK